MSDKSISVGKVKYRLITEKSRSSSKKSGNIIHSANYTRSLTVSPASRPSHAEYFEDHNSINGSVFASNSETEYGNDDYIMDDNTCSDYSLLNKESNKRKEPCKDNNTITSEDEYRKCGGLEKRVRPNSYKAYHRQIEKKRRNKINDMINEIASLVPMCQNVSHRLDKLSVLELAVQHMRMVTNSNSDGAEESVYKPPILSEEEVKYLIENNSDGFLLVLSSDKVQILYISDAISASTSHTPLELVGRSLLEIVHPKDVPVITGMLSPYPSLPLINGTNKSNTTQSSHTKGSLGSKRSFLFRLKASKQPQFDPSSASKSNRYRQTITGSSMVTVQCNGFLKSWQVSAPPTSSEIDSDTHLSTFTCFIAIAKPLSSNDQQIPITTVIQSMSGSQSMVTEHTNTPKSVQGSVASPSNSGSEQRTNERFNSSTNSSLMPKQYSSRHNADSSYLCADGRVFPIAGYLPQDLIGNCEYKFIHKDDVEALTETYRQVLESKHQERIVSEVYRFKMKHGGTIPIRTVAFSLFNPFTKKLEFVSHENFVMGSKDMSGVSSKRVVVPHTRQKLALKARFDAVGRIHDDADNRSYAHSDNPEADDNVYDTSPSMTCETKNEEIMLKPYSMNVLKHSGINTDILSEILKKHEKLSKEPSRNNNHTVTELNDEVIDNSHYSNQHDILNGVSINGVRDNMRASYANYLYEKDIASSGYGSTVDDSLFS